MASLNIPQTIADYANASGVDPTIALELAVVESSLNQSAISSAGAVGIMQLMPASFPGVNIQDAQTNIQTGISYIAQLLAQFGGDYQAALAAYNWGPSRVVAAQAKYGDGWFSTIPSSVQNYVDTILGNASTQYSATISVPIVTSVDDSDSADESDVAGDASQAFQPAPAAVAAGGIDTQTLLIGLAVLLGIGVALNYASD